MLSWEDRKVLTMKIRKKPYSLPDLMTAVLHELAHSLVAIASRDRYDRLMEDKPCSLCRYREGGVDKCPDCRGEGHNPAWFAIVEKVRCF